jgi:hypothetical protein
VHQRLLVRGDDTLKVLDRPVTRVTREIRLLEEALRAEM